MKQNNLKKKVGQAGKLGKLKEQKTNIYNEIQTPLIIQQGLQKK